MLAFKKFLLSLPFVDRENKQLLWQTPLERCTIPSFLILKLNSRPRDIFGPDSFSLSEINWSHPFVGQKRVFFAEKNSFRQQTNNFVKSICFLRPWRRKYFFSREEENVLFKVSLRPAKLFFSSSKSAKFYILPDNNHFCFYYAAR